MLIPFIERGMDVEMDVEIFDVIGKLDFKNLVKDAYFFNADGFLAVCDTSNEDSLDGLYDWIDEGRRIAGNIPVHVLLNKTDLKKKKIIRDYHLTNCGWSLLRRQSRRPPSGNPPLGLEVNSRRQVKLI